MPLTDFNNADNMTIFNFCCLLIELYDETYYTSANSIFTSQDHINDLVAYQQ